jgi:hypothetical protein
MGQGEGCGTRRRWCGKEATQAAAVRSRGDGFGRNGERARICAFEMLSTMLTEHGWQQRIRPGRRRVQRVPLQRTSSGGNGKLAPRAQQVRRLVGVSRGAEQLHDGNACKRERARVQARSGIYSATDSTAWSVSGKGAALGARSVSSNGHSPAKQLSPSIPIHCAQTCPPQGPSAPSIEHRAPSIQHPASSIQRPAPPLCCAALLTVVCSVACSVVCSVLSSLPTPAVPGDVERGGGPPCHGEQYTVISQAIVVGDAQLPESPAPGAGKACSWHRRRHARAGVLLRPDAGLRNSETAKHSCCRGLPACHDRSRPCACRASLGLSPVAARCSRHQRGRGVSLWRMSQGCSAAGFRSRSRRGETIGSLRSASRQGLVGRTGDLDPHEHLGVSAEPCHVTARECDVSRKRVSAMALHHSILRAACQAS